MTTRAHAHRRILTAAVLSTCAAALPTRANTDIWTGTTGNWSLGSNWSLGTAPASGDTVSLTQTDALNRTVTLNVSPPSLAGVTIDSTGNGRLTFSQSANVLTATASEYLGYSGTASYAQTGGTNNASDLYLGYNASATGSYSLSNSTLASLKTNNQYLGYNGTASFTQSNGTNTVASTASLFLAYNAGSSASYTLSGGKLLATAAYLGGSSSAPGGAAKLTITGGSANFSSLKIWNSTGTSLSLAGGSLSLGSFDLDPSRFSWTLGALSLTNPADHTLGPTSLLGSTLNLPSGKGLTLAGSLTAPAGTAVNLTGGALNIGSLDTDPARFSWTTGSLILNNAANYTLGPTSFLGSSLNLPANKNLTLVAGSLAAPAGTAVAVTGGTLNIAAASQLDGPLTVSGTTGTLNGAGDLTASSLTWSGGTLTGTGRITIPSTGSLAINANGNVLYRTLDNNGSATLTGGNYTLQATFNNNAGATLVISGSPQSFSGTGTFNNAGTITKTGTGSASIPSTFNNAGPAASVNVQGGTLAIGAGTHSAPFTVAAGATLSLYSATFNAGATVNGQGNLLFTYGHSVFNDAVNLGGTLSIPYSCSATFNAPVSLNSFTLSGGGGLYFNTTPTLAPSNYTLTYGTLAGAADVTMPAGSTFTWTDGYLGDPTSLPNTAKFTIAQGAAADVQVGYNQLLSRPLVNAGHLTITPLGATLGTLSFLAGASLTNLPGATLTLDNLNYSGNIQLWTNDTPTTSFNNAGTFVKTASLPDSYAAIRTPFNNAGPQASVSIQSGTLGLAGGGTHSAPFTIAANATLELNVFGGSHTFNHGATVTGAGALRISGGTATFNDSIDITGPLTMTGGAVVTITADATVSSLAILTNSPLNLTTASLQVTNTAATPADTVRLYLLAGRLISSAADSTHRLGYIVSGTTLTVHLTPAGDANLDGRIDADDYALVDRSFAKSLASALWTNGDFNYDGTITSADYLLLDTTYLQQQGGTPSPALLAQRESQFGDAYVSSLIASVPEPTTLSLLGFATLPFLPRRRTKS